jgi:hypothetical protein
MSEYPEPINEQAKYDLACEIEHASRINAEDQGLERFNSDNEAFVEEEEHR